MKVQVFKAYVAKSQISNFSSTRYEPSWWLEEIGSHAGLTWFDEVVLLPDLNNESKQIGWKHSSSNWARLWSEESEEGDS